MSLSEDTVFSKLNALNDTQEGIVSIAQWVMFHRRHAKRFAELWLTRLRESSASRRLNLIYLANEVVQQMKIRKKEDFSQAFSPIMADACEATYKQSPADIQQKLRRVIGVWRQRNIFENDVLVGIETRLDDLDKGKPTSGGMRRLGGLGGGSVPSELSKLVAAQQKLGSRITNASLSFEVATSEYTKNLEAEMIPTPPVYAARLSQLLQTLDTAHVAVKDALTSREELIKNLESLLESNKAALAGEEAQLKEITTKRDKTDQVKKDVENMILSGLNGTENQDASMRSTTPEIEPDMVEALTPPPADEPMPAPPPQQQHQHQQSDSGPFSFHSPTTQHPPPGSDLLSSMMTSQAYSNVFANTGNSNSNNNSQETKPVDNPMAGLDGLDDDLVAIFKREAAEAQKQNSSNNNSNGTVNQQQQQQQSVSQQADDDDEYHP